MTGIGNSGCPKLEAQGIRLEYFQPRTNSRLTALDGVDLAISEGEFVSIVGPSGCGKTTFLSVVDGLVAASTGRVLVDGVAVTRPGPDRAMVFQEASLLPWRTVLGNVCYGLECLRISRREREERAHQLIELVGLSGFEHHYPYELSGGMQQRVNLARALLVDPKILLMDEPFASLDAQTRELMQEELLRIWLRAKKTVLFVTHQIDEAIYLSDRVIVFSRRPGRVKETIRVEIERPRPLGVKREPHFHAIEDRIWSLIEEDLHQREAYTSKKISQI
jgi:NitT/TauT family transport system ATP-binding protein